MTDKLRGKVGKIFRAKTAPANRGTSRAKNKIKHVEWNAMASAILPDRGARAHRKFYGQLGSGGGGVAAAPAVRLAAIG